MNLTLSRFDSPLGELLIVTDSQARLRALGFADHQSKLRRQLRERYGSCELVAATQRFGREVQWRGTGCTSDTGELRHDQR